jgi:hypothetical protein
MRRPDFAGHTYTPSQKWIPEYDGRVMLML